jgi:hypothetical protein
MLLEELLIVPKEESKMRSPFELRSPSYVPTNYSVLTEGEREGRSNLIIRDSDYLDTIK